MLGCYCQGKNGNRTEGSTAAPSDSHDPEWVQGDKRHCWGHERGGLCSHKCGPTAGAAVSAGAHPGHRSQLAPRDKCQARLERIFLTNTGRKTVHKNTAKASRAVLTQEQPGGAHPGLGEHRAAAPGLWCDTGDTWGHQEDNTSTDPQHTLSLQGSEQPWHRRHPLENQALASRLFLYFSKEFHRRGSHQTHHLNRTERSSDF